MTVAAYDSVTCASRRRSVRLRHSGKVGNVAMFLRGRNIRLFGRRDGGFFAHVLRLVGHLAASAFIFVTVFSLGWLIGFAVHKLHSIHPFSDRILGTIETIEVSILYLDVAVSLVVLLVGSARFMQDVLSESVR